MRAPLVVVVTLALVSAIRPAVAQAPARTIARLVAAPSLAGTAPARPAWSPDGVTLAFLWHDAARPARELWLVPRTGGAPRRVTRFTEEGSRAGIGEFAWLPDGHAVIALRGGEAWRVPLDGAAPTRLDGVRDAADLTVAPDGATIAWLTEGDLFTRPTTGGAVRRLTTLGRPPLDAIPLGTYWRNDREIGRATWASDAPPYAWSPDGRTIAVHVVDRTALPTVIFPHHLGGETAPHPLRRSYPGQPNESRTVALVDVASGALRALPLDAPTATRVVELQWSPKGELLIDRESDDAVRRTLHVARADGTVRTVWTDVRESRVYTDIGSTWDAAGERLVVTSDREDRYRAYALRPGDTALVARTPATSDIAGAATVAGRRLFWVSTDPSPAERHVWMREGDGAPVRLTTLAGQHAPTPSPDGRTVALVSSNDTMPPELWLVEARAGAVARRITVSPPPEFASYRWLPGRYVTVPSRSGATLHVRLLEPPDLRPGTRYPVLVGPAYSNTVRNRWSGLYGMFQQHLAADRGYIVVQVDMRGSTGYGRAFRESFLMDWGGGDLDDLEDVVRWLRGQSHVDPARVGVWGSSYGGTLTVYALLKKPGLFNAGVAGAPATDPFAFGSDDVAIVRTPQQFPTTFERGAHQYAANLRDPLMIIHGTMDDVVPFRTTAALGEAFMRAGRTDFELVAVPGATHAWTARPHHATYLLGRLVDFFDRRMPVRMPARTP